MIIMTIMIMMKIMILAVIKTISINNMVHICLHYKYTEEQFLPNVVLNVVFS